MIIYYKFSIYERAIHQNPQLICSKKSGDFVKNELLLDTNVSPDEFWKGFDKVVHELAPKNKKLLKLEKPYNKK